MSFNVAQLPAYKAKSIGNQTTHASNSNALLELDNLVSVFGNVNLEAPEFVSNCEHFLSLLSLPETLLTEYDQVAAVMEKAIMAYHNRVFPSISCSWMTDDTDEIPKCTLVVRRLFHAAEKLVARSNDYALKLRMAALYFLLHGDQYNAVFEAPPVPFSDLDSNAIFALSLDLWGGHHENSHMYPAAQQAHDQSYLDYMIHSLDLDSTSSPSSLHSFEYSPMSSPLLPPPSEFAPPSCSIAKGSSRVGPSLPRKRRNLFMNTYADDPKTLPNLEATTCGRRKIPTHFPVPSPPQIATRSLRRILSAPNPSSRIKVKLQAAQSSVSQTTKRKLQKTAQENKEAPRKQKVRRDHPASEKAAIEKENDENF